ncbi:MAG: purine-nucleoside phosphorylase [Clostridium sp.]|nr:purine-nucleoside phosphorylase [Clostridium sp.]
MNISLKINEAFDYLRNKTKYKPTIGIVLGTGLGELANEVKEAEYYDFKDIPNFITPTVEGHEGKLVIGKLKKKDVVIMQGRLHYYEGNAMNKITLPIRVMKLLGVKTLILTNCAGQTTPTIVPGDIVLLKDHINLSGNNPLIGKNLNEFGPRFPDMSNAYDKDLRKKIKTIADSLNINLKEGVYAMFSGPNYESIAETKMAGILGADVVGMSTLPEVIVANHCGMKVAAFSTIVSMAAAFSDEELSHEDILNSFNDILKKCILIIKHLVEDL